MYPKYRTQNCTQNTVQTPLVAVYYAFIPFNVECKQFWCLFLSQESQEFQAKD